MKVLPSRLLHLSVTFLLIMFANPAFSKDVRFVTDFGAFPDDGKDDTEALRAAAEYCRNNPSTTLVFEAGNYILKDEQAIDLERRVMNGEYGEDPEKKMFVPYHDYVKGLDFSGCIDVTVKASGAKLVCEGWMEIISLEDTEDFTLEGLTINYLRKPMSEGIVEAVKDNEFIVNMTRPSAFFSSTSPIPRVVLWDNDIDGAYSTAFYFAREEVMEGNRVRFRGNIPARMVGSHVSALHTFHYRPAIFIHESQNTHLDNVTINAHCGMGVVGFHTKDVFMDHLSVVPADGFHFSTNTDATHFSSCEGTISFDHCFFQGQGDDATNVHGYYHDITSAEGNIAVLELRSPTFTHCQIADIPRIGDEMTLVRINDLVPVRKYKVREVWHEDKAVPFKVRLNGKLPEKFNEYYLINSSLMPSLIFRNCCDYGHIARSVLVKTGNVLIENNIFKGVTMTPVILCCESPWKEGWHCEHAVIRNNHFENCSTTDYCGGAAIATRVEAPDNQNSLIHKDILIEGNTFRRIGSKDQPILIENAKKVRVRNNTYLK